MANLNNLMPIEEVNSRRSREQHSEDSRRGGIASAKAKKARKAMKEAMNMLLNSEVKDGDAKSILEELDIPESEQNLQMVLLMSEFKRAVQGDKESLKFITDLIGETPQTQSADPTKSSSTIIVDDLEYEEDAEEDTED